MSRDAFEEIVRSLRPRTSVIGRRVERRSLADRMAEFNVPAVSIAIVDGDDEPVARAFGTEVDTLFQAASISKPVAAVGAVRLAADGVIDLDRDINEILKSWHVPDGDGVTPRRILSHSAGLSIHGFPGYERAGPIPSTVQILDGVAPANTEAVRVVRPPGEAYQYSGGGFTVLQLALEDATGESFASLMRRVVLDPLGMDASTYEQPLPAHLHGLAATGHDEDGKPIAGDWHVYPEQAAAGLWTSPRELALVVLEVLRPGRVLSEETRNAMLSPQVDEHRGIGWMLDSPWFQHGGSNAGFRCLAAGSVAQQRVAVVMTNADRGGLLCEEVLAATAEVLGWRGILREKTAIDLDDAAMQAIAGDYEISEEERAVLSIHKTDGRLVSSGLGLPELELFASSPTEFFRTDIDATIVWSEDKITINAGGDEIVANRVVS